MNSYTLGQQIRLRATVKNLSGTATDAASVTIKIRPQGGVLATAIPTHDSTGSYYYDWEPTDSGVYTIRTETINPDAAAESQVYILPTALI